ncbi:MAG: protein translocase subunit SecD [Kiritimatiellae bacterium]|nr:protein translocase subunit SecD [Kiritimatiellia bacterium]
MSKESAVRNNIWKWLVLLLIAVVSFYVTTPVQEKLRFGLDLKGGTSFTLGVDTDKLAESIIAENPDITNKTGAVEAKIDEILKDCDARIIEVIRRRVDAMGTNEPVIQGMKDHRLLVQLPGVDEEVRKAAKASLQSAAYLEFRLTHAKNDQLVAKLLSKDVAPEGYVKKGSGYARTENLWKEVSKTPGYAARLAAFEVPDPRYVFMLEDNGDGTYAPNFVARRTDPQVTGEHLEAAAVERDPTTGQLSIGFRLNSEGAQKFATLTRNYKAGGPKNPTGRGRQLAIILDDQLISAPVIQSEIGANGQITGRFDGPSAQKLANELNAGALPAPMKILAESTVSPTVGEDAKHAGIIAACLGFCLVAIFMFIYYWMTGLVADIALFLDIALLPTALVFVANILGVFAHDPAMGGGGSMQLPVLTMPGIAGLVLSLGMAVDANVLIFERIREEFAAGRRAGDAIKNGYGRAFTAIFDSNLTTIITGIILFVVGTGPVRGFAIMLTAGVVISMFTAVVVTRLVFDHCVETGREAPFRMMQFFKNPNFDFMKITKFTVGGSFAFIAVALAIFAIRFMNNRASVLAVDLTGGTSIVYNLKQDAKPAIADIRAALNDFDNATVIQYQDGGVGDSTLLVKTGETAETKKGSQLEGKDVGAYVTKLLREKFPQAEIAPASVDEVGSMVGADLKKSGSYAVLFSLVAILIYVGFRFQFGFGLGALVALAHDALISLAIFSLCGRQVSLIVITALLTIIGYSVNDTVVVFDRIREQLRHDRRMTFAELCNSAVNACLGRTVITSVTTFFAVLALFAFGDGSIFDFALTMLIGVVAGTYSSVFIATPVMMWWYKGKRPEFEAEAKTQEG